MNRYQSQLIWVQLLLMRTQHIYLPHHLQTHTHTPPINSLSLLWISDCIVYLHQSTSLQNENESPLNGITLVHNIAYAMFVFCGPCFSTNLSRWLHWSEKHLPLATLSKCRCETKMKPSKFQKYAKVDALTRTTNTIKCTYCTHTHEMLSNKQTNHIHCYYCFNSLHSTFPI